MRWKIEKCPGIYQARCLTRTIKSSFQVWKNKYNQFFQLLSSCLRISYSCCCSLWCQFKCYSWPVVIETSSRSSWMNNDTKNCMIKLCTINRLDISTFMTFLSLPGLHIILRWAFSIVACWCWFLHLQWMQGTSELKMMGLLS